MGSTYRVTHCFQGQGGTTRDMYCNQFYFYSDAKVAADVGTWGGPLAAIVHQIWVSGTPSVSYYMSHRCLGGLGVTKIYDVTGNPPTAGPPIFSIEDFVLIPADDYLSEVPDDCVNLPEEVAVCLSYEAVHTGGNLPRRRGRIYLGPLNTYAIETGPGLNNTRAAVSGTLMNNILAAAVTMQSSAAAYDFEWRVFSTMDGFAFKIVNFSVDNAFDTVRGRGTAPTSRLSLPIS